MSMDIAMSLVAGVPSKGGERGGKGADAEASGFGEMLADKTGRVDKRMPKDARSADAEDAPTQWRIGGYDARLAMAMPRIDRLAAQEDVPPPAEPGMMDEAEIDADTALAVVPSTDAEAAVNAAKSGDAAIAATAQTQRQKGDRERPAEPTLAVGGASDAGDGEAEDVNRPATGSGRDASSATKPDGAPTPRQDAATASQAQVRQAGVTNSAAGGQATPPPVQTGDAAAEQQRPVTTTAQSDATRASDVRPQPSSQQAADTAQPRVNVLGFTSSVAPAAPNPAQLSPTAAGLVATMEAEPAWRAAAAEAAAATGSRSQAQTTVSTLRIQLNPAELGMVTARLTATGAQLEIEIRVESNDARQRLANDSDAILKALRAVGYDVDKVTIQQASHTGGAPAQQGSGGGRDAFLQGQQQAGENARGRNGQGSEDSERAGGNGGNAGAERSGGGVYI